MKAEQIFYQKWKSRIGVIHLYSNQDCLLAILFSKQHEEFITDYPLACIVNKSTKIIDKAIVQLEQYFDGKRKNFDLKLKIKGTDFQKKAWKELAEIPFGKTISYGTQAARIKSRKAVRAVGSANSRNLFAIVVPCHRVIASNGKISGYAGGVGIKKKLLELEQSYLS